MRGLAVVFGVAALIGCGGGGHGKPDGGGSSSAALKGADGMSRDAYSQP
jgi:hypothetical protein